MLLQCISTRSPTIGRFFLHLPNPRPVSYCPLSLAPGSTSSRLFHPIAYRNPPRPRLCPTYTQCHLTLAPSAQWRASLATAHSPFVSTGSTVDDNVGYRFEAFSQIPGPMYCTPPLPRIVPLRDTHSAPEGGDECPLVSRLATALRTYVYFASSFCFPRNLHLALQQQVSHFYAVKPAT